MISLSENRSQLDTEIADLFEQGEEADADWDDEGEFEQEPEATDVPLLEEPTPERIFPELTGENLHRAAEHYKSQTRMPKPSDITEADIQATKKKTRAAAMTKQVMSVALTTLNRAMNELLFTLPQTQNMTDEEVRALPGFPTQGEINDALLDFLSTSGLHPDWFKDGLIEGESDPEDMDAFQYMADGNAGRAKRWSPQYAWARTEAGRRGGARGKRTPARAIPELVRWPGDLPSSEWVAEKYAVDVRSAQRYLKQARMLRGEP